MTSAADPTPGWPPPPPPPAGSAPPPGYGAPPAGWVQPYAAYGYGMPVRPQVTNGLAIASMVLGIVWIYWLGSVLAVVFGHVALSQIKRNPHQTGRGMAIAGLVLGYVGIAVLALVIVAVVAAAGSAGTSTYPATTDF